MESVTKITQKYIYKLCLEVGGKDSLSGMEESLHCVEGGGRDWITEDKGTALQEKKKRRERKENDQSLVSQNF